MVRIIALHYHWRPGGVRAVVERALPPLAARLRARVVLAAGEPPPREWLQRLRRQIPAVESVVFPEFGYGAPAMARVRERLQSLLSESGHDDVLWAQNLSLGRNFPLAAAVASALPRLRVVLHHHDFWFDQRAGRWQALAEAGCRSAAEAAAVFFPSGEGVRHVVLSGRLQAAFAPHVRVSCLPNPESTSRGSLQAGGAWLKEAGLDSESTFLMPSRLMRRKNIGEGLLLARLLHPRGTCLTPGGVSAEEGKYVAALRAAVRPGQWRTWPAMGGPNLPDLLAASAAVLVTSLQEGFGLVPQEAALHGIPLVARRHPELQRMGAGWAYDELLIPAVVLPSREAEEERRMTAWANWRGSQPLDLQRLVPDLPELPRESAPFSGLTLEAQQHVLALPAEAVAPANSWLREARQAIAAGPPATRAAAGVPKSCPVFSAEDFAEEFERLLEEPGPPPCPAVGDPVRLQEELVRLHWQPHRLFPLLWSC